MENTGERYIPGKAEVNSNDFTHWQRYIAVEKLVKDKVVLDIACGSGYGSKNLSKNAKFIYGIDISQEAVDYAIANYQRENIKFQQGSIEGIPLDNNSVDVIISFETIEHVDLPMQKKFLSEVIRVLKEDGIFVVSCPNKQIATDLMFELWGTKNDFHVKEHYIQEFEELLGEYFLSIQLYYQRLEISTIISNEKTTILPIIMSNDKKSEDTQNIIAICGNQKNNEYELSSIILDVNQQYINLLREFSSISKYNETLKEEIQNIQKRKLYNILDKLSQIYSKIIHRS